MKHTVKKFKLAGGQDANQMLSRKLVTNFITHGTIRTTEKRSKHVVQQVQKLVAAFLRNNKTNTILKFFGTPKKATLFTQAINVRDISYASGCVRIEKLGMRKGDAAPIARVSWVSQMKKKQEDEDKDMPAHDTRSPATEETKSTGKQSVTKKSSRILKTVTTKS